MDKVQPGHVGIYRRRIVPPDPASKALSLGKVRGLSAITLASTFHLVPSRALISHQQWSQALAIAFAPSPVT